MVHVFHGREWMIHVVHGNYEWFTCCTDGSEWFTLYMEIINRSHVAWTAMNGSRVHICFEWFAEILNGSRVFWACERFTKRVEPTISLLRCSGALFHAHRSVVLLHGCDRYFLLWHAERLAALSIYSAGTIATLWQCSIACIIKQQSCWKWMY